MNLDITSIDPFHLKTEFLNNFKTKEVPWGYGDLSWVTYKRTYARELGPSYIRPDSNEEGKEDWWQTCRRVVEGVINVQKIHCKETGTPWKPEKARSTAREMYKRMFKFKWTPPGRGLWQMGTDFMFERTGAGLMNCGFISTENIDMNYSQPFTWAIQMSMLGVGVGYDTDGAGEVEIQEPEVSDDTHTIGDSREEWARALGRLLNAFVGEDTLPKEWDYSEIRPQGAPIESFGGTASGPGPLKEMLERVEDMHRDYIGKKVDSVLISDTFNLVGKCVVAGGTRRSAMIALGDKEDQDFLDLKTDPEKVQDYRWASNNSIYAEKGMDYGEVAERTVNNGEPGYVWMENVHEYGRTQDEDSSDYRAKGFNPCVTGDTKVAVADGRDAVPIKDLAEDGGDVPVYAVNPDTGKVEIKKGRHPRKTGENKKILRVHLDGDSHIDVTPNHEFLLRDGTRREAKNLEEGDRLMRFTKNSEKLSQDKDALYYRVYGDVRDPSQDKIFEHRMIKKFQEEEKWENLFDKQKENGWLKNGGVVVHHKNRNTLDNRPENLEIMPFSEHSRLHGKNDHSEEDNPRFSGFTNEEVEEHAIRLTKELGRRFSKQEWEKFCDQTGLPKGPFNNFRSQDGWFETATELSKWAAEQCGVNNIHQDPRVVRQYHDMIDNGYAARINDKKEKYKVEVKRQCEQCENYFWIKAGRREQSFCSQTCFRENLNGSDEVVEKLNEDDEIIEKRNNSIQEHYENVKKERRQKQAKVYAELKEDLGEQPLKKQWEEACKERNIPFRTGKKSPFRYWKDVVEAGENYNHRVDRVEELDQKQDVYNITVDDHHTVGFVTESYENKHGGPNWNGIFTAQCGEQPLESGELCTLIECYPAHHDSYEDFEKTLKVAYQYGKTATLIPTHSKNTNQVMNRNRRIGCSITGVVQAINKHGYRNFFDWCDEGYEYIQYLDEKYSNWLGVPQSVRTTTVKPSGTVSTLSGSTPGVHWDHSPKYLRRVRVQEGHDILDLCRDAGYPIEDDKYSDRTKIVEFPVEVENMNRSKKEVSVREKVDLAAQVQYYWSDNSVSTTAEYNPDKIGPSDIERILEAYEDRLKSISFLPSKDHGYAQPPYEEISQEEYEERVEEIDPVSKKDFERDREDKFCSGQSCKIDPD